MGRDVRLEFQLQQPRNSFFHRLNLLQTQRIMSINSLDSSLSSQSSKNMQDVRYHQHYQYPNTLLKICQVKTDLDQDSFTQLLGNDSNMDSDTGFLLEDEIMFICSVIEIPSGENYMTSLWVSKAFRDCDVRKYCSQLIDIHERAYKCRPFIKTVSQSELLESIADTFYNSAGVESYYLPTIPENSNSAC